MTAQLILAFDTSGPWCSTALVQGDRVLASRFEEMNKGQGERLMTLVQATMDDDGLPLDVLDAIAVGIGPGNFTGIRIAVAAARGLALALGVPAIGVSNFEVLRGPASRQALARQLVSLPARRGGLFLQAFENGHESGPAQMMETLQTPFWDMFPDLDETEILGHEADDLALIHPPSYEPSGPSAHECALPARLTASIIAQIAADKLTDGTRQPRPAPLYIKPADAAPSRENGPVIL
ncbi:MAG TPA: tRNA (adenosine(37)-N6)-threonylcarbamoyltransferase complex dimerization subunit type 1 TsaB [Roseibacterium sp.]|nr:tRNA (adenosine(37)-N6)-threonylcarbamoyltransferase complex dimerization subunit type 1 TsaB [Roseibacterium sp.]